MNELLEYCYYNILITVSLYFFLMSLANHYEMWRFTHGPEIFDGPLVSVLIPMRNEEKNVLACLNGLQNQLYKNYEILVLNDNSDDNTLDILENISAQDNRIKIYNGLPLPDDWYGKPFALHQLTEHAKGDIFLLTDADTRHNPASISWAVTNMEYLKADMISGYTGQILKTFGEIITVPLMFFTTGFAIPLFMNRFSKSAMFSAAIGQYIAIKKNVLKEIGGCLSFKKITLEDIFLSRLIKKRGYSTRFLNITEHVSCRMYESYRGAIEGIGKTLSDFLGKNVFIIPLLAIGVIFFFLLPLPLLFILLITGSKWTLNIFIVNILFTLTWLFMFLNQRLNWWYCFLWPLMFLNLLYMAFWSWLRTISGKGFIWKGRKVN